MDPRATQPTGNADERRLDPLLEDGFEDDAPDPDDPDSDPELDEADDEDGVEDDQLDLDDEDDADERYADDLDEDDQEQALAGAPRPSATPADFEALVHYVVSRLVADPDAIEIASEQRGGTVYLALRVPETDLGRVIGREGRTAKAIRTLVSIAGSKHQLHARLDIDG